MSRSILRSVASSFARRAVRTALPLAGLCASLVSPLAALEPAGGNKTAPPADSSSAPSAVEKPLAAPTRPEPNETAAAATGERRTPEAAPEPRIEFLAIDDVREGMRGYGRTVMHGTELTEFQAEVLGVLRSYAPGRDLVLCKLSGGGLETSGVVAGMSGSPVYIDGKLLGAVAYAWPYAKEPIAGVTPISQMKASAEKPVDSDVVALPLRADGVLPVAALDDVRGLWSPDADATPAAADASDDDNPLARPVSASPGGMRPISTPLAATGIGPATLARLEKALSPLGMTAVAAGGAGRAAASAERELIVPGSSLSCGLIMGDMDLSGIGTTTHVEGDRVWGWGHPMMLNGRCEYSMRAGYIHHVNSKLTVSTKMGSPLGFFGTIDADVGACVAGQLGRTPDLLPLNLSIRLPDGQTKTLRVQIVRHPALLGSLTSTVFGGAIEELGKLPAELTLRLDAAIEIAGHEPIVWRDAYSGGSYSGSDGALRLLGQIANVVSGLARSPFGRPRLERIDCELQVSAERRCATIDYVRLPDPVVEPGERVEIVVGLKPHDGRPCERTLTLEVPRTLPPGEHTLRVCDAPSHLRECWTERPHLMESRTVAEQVAAYRRQLSEPRNQLFVRLPLPERGLAVNGLALPNLPAGARAVLAGKSSVPTRAIRESLAIAETTDWVVEGDSEISLRVAAPRLGN